MSRNEATQIKRERERDRERERKRERERERERERSKRVNEVNEFFFFAPGSSSLRIPHPRNDYSVRRTDNNQD